MLTGGIMSFDEWFDAQDYIVDDGCYQEKYLAARDAWIAQEERVIEVIERLERYPTCASCYLTVEESIAASKIKARMVKLLRGVYYEEFRYSGR